MSAIKGVDRSGSLSHPRGIENGYGIGGAKNSIYSIITSLYSVNRNRKRNGIGNARIRTCTLPFKTLLVLWLLIYGGPFSSPEPPGGLSTKTRRLWDTRFEVLDFRTSGHLRFRSLEDSL